MNSNTILDMPEKDYKEMLKEVAKELSKRNNSAFKVEYAELLKIDLLKINLTHFASVSHMYIQNHQYEDKTRKKKNKEIDELANYIFSYDIYLNESEENKSFIINEWIKLLDASRTTYSQKLMAKVKQLRLKEGLTQKNIANRLNISYQAYAHYEKGRRVPDINTIVNLAKIFDVTVDFLLSISDTKFLDIHFKVVDTKKDFLTRLYENEIKVSQLNKLDDNAVAMIADIVKRLSNS